MAPLCDACSQSLILDDRLAGGGVDTSLSDGTVDLNLSGFSTSEWEPRLDQGSRQRLGQSSRNNRQEVSSDPEDGRVPGPDHNKRLCCVSNNLQRCVTPPAMPEFSTPAAEGCVFCSRLKQLFNEEYKEDFWWENPDSKLYFWIQYEWTEHHSKRKKKYNSFNCLTVMVYRPELEEGCVDTYEFTVCAWPGNSTNPNLEVIH
ncbi:uncharacterized protein K452DRAFT_304849 [Aplosporella prunicola CBS 121167]|uniref:Uncharacterized protein n=1 Tax=Aplosporella prunicola CBS 121167 TaxID=1176127 RepID=A0A6A6BT28_9PEZI|nr:uncharacterized protein K452DRAFT_304849 [Aplosporella prunicola CBS 121167]KAF2146948.1 hypothetical protein K452DRAFT_304849 [Aplosporella prunicola CBS 121167]